jgi:hypothetical protein
MQVLLRAGKILSTTSFSDYKAFNCHSLVVANNLYSGYGDFNFYDTTLPNRLLGANGNKGDGLI